MKPQYIYKLLKVVSANLACVAGFVLPCAIIAQDAEAPMYYTVVEDPKENFISLQNFKLAFIFTFNPERFDELWPHYGYSHEDLKDSNSLCSDARRRNIAIGRIAVARHESQEQRTFTALPIEASTNYDALEEFLSNQTDPGNDDSTDDSRTFTVGDMCRILFDNFSTALENAVVVTQHPLPLPHYTYRLLEESTLASSPRTRPIVQSMEIPQ